VTSQTQSSFTELPASPLQYWRIPDPTSATKRNPLDLLVETFTATLLPFPQGINNLRLAAIRTTLAAIIAPSARFSHRRFYDDLTKVLASEWSDELQLALSGVLRTAEAHVQETVLGCLADLDAVLTGPLLHEAAALIHSKSLITARNAAMALSAGGSEAVDILHLELEKVPQEARDKIEKLLHFANR